MDLLREQQNKARQATNKKLPTQPLETVEKVAKSIHEGDKEIISKEEITSSEKKPTRKKKKKVYDENEKVKRTSIDYPMSIFTAIKKAALDSNLSFRDFVLSHMVKHSAVKKYLNQNDDNK